MSTEQKTDSRRSTHLASALTVIVSGKDAQGQRFEEQTDTVSIDKLGGRMRMQHPIVAGRMIQLRRPGDAQPVLCRIVWTAPSKGPMGGQCGFEFVDLVPAWNIESPPEDWRGVK